MYLMTALGCHWLREPYEQQATHVFRVGDVMVTVVSTVTWRVPLPEPDGEGQAEGQARKRAANLSAYRKDGQARAS
jgi:hypothetical protein